MSQNISTPSLRYRRRPSVAPLLSNGPGRAARWARCFLASLMLLAWGAAARAQGPDLTGTRWKTTFQGMPDFEVVFFDGRPGGNVSLGFTTSDGERSILYEGSYDGRNLQLSSPRVNQFAGEKLTIEAQLSYDGARITGTERHILPSMDMDESDPVEFVRLGVPSPPGSGGGTATPGGSSPAGSGGPPGHGSEGAGPVAVAVLGGLLGLGAGAALGGILSGMSGGAADAASGLMQGRQLATECERHRQVLDHYRNEVNALRDNYANRALALKRRLGKVDEKGRKLQWGAAKLYARRAENLMTEAEGLWRDCTFIDKSVGSLVIKVLPAFYLAYKAARAGSAALPAAAAVPGAGWGTAVAVALMTAVLAYGEDLLKSYAKSYVTDQAVGEKLQRLRARAKQLEEQARQDDALAKAAMERFTALDSLRQKIEWELQSAWEGTNGLLRSRWEEAKASHEFRRLRCFDDRPWTFGSALEVPPLEGIPDPLPAEDVARMRRGLLPTSTF